MNKTPEELYKARTKRIEDAIQLEVPDRVPVALSLGYFPAKYVGITCEDAFYNAGKWKEAAIKTVVDFEPDSYIGLGTDSGDALEALDFKQMVWPGHGTSPNHTHQFVEGEYMKASEYDAFLEDPTGFILQTFLPRTCGNLEALQRLPNLSILLFSPTMLLGMPGFDGAIEALLKARQALFKRNAEIGLLGEELKQLGFPPFSSAATFAPFDVISDRLRGMRGSMLDMFRQPDNILKACEKLLPVMLGLAVTMAKMSGNLLQILNMQMAQFAGVVEAQASLSLLVANLMREQGLMTPEDGQIFDHIWKLMIQSQSIHDELSLRLQTILGLFG